MRRTLSLLPLPFCIALSLSAQAAEPASDDWGLCPVESAVPEFTEAQTAPSAPELRTQLPTDIEGDSVTGAEGASTTFSGNVALTRGDQFLGTDNLVYDSETGKYVADGNVRYQDSGMRLIADRAEGDQNADSHNVKNVRYQLTERRGNGGAEHIEMQGSQGTLYGSTYSTCPPGQRGWQLRAERIDIDNEEGMGTARNATLRVGRVPVLYVPWFTFPVDNRRRTGLLYPRIGLSGRNGFDWRQPIYLNLAPNYDMTLTPRLMTNRGFMLGTEFRYLIENGQGTFDFAYLPSDKLADREREEEIALGIPPENRRDDDRGIFRYEGHQNLGPAWQARADLTWISDPRYIEDFSNTLNGVSNYQLNSNLGLYGRGRYWDAGLMADHYQLADYTLFEYQMPYDRLPRAYLRWNQPFGRWLTAGVDAEAVRFQHIDDYTRSELAVSDASPLDPVLRPGGSRVDIKPYVTLPLEGASWFMRPTLAWRHTAYQLDEDLADRIAYNRAAIDAVAGNGAGALPSANDVDDLRNTSPDRSLPIASFDAGLFFDRDTTLGGKPYMHTLEPRLFYLNAPYRDQDDLPLFDTSPLTFSWGQLFRDNRFSGPDRQADANQLTLAMSTRFVRQSDGLEKFSASVGQIRYFEDSRVGLTPDAPVLEKGRSAWVADASYAINDRWSMGASYQWDPKAREKDLVSFRTRYLIGDDGIVNLGYRYRRNLGYNPAVAVSAANNPDLLEQVDFSFLYPLSPAWSVVGRYYYSLEDRKLLESIAGVQWDSCCIAARLVARRYLRNRTGELNDALQLEIELKGLGSAGPDTAGRLRRAILGYNREDLYLVPPPEVDTRGDDDSNGSLYD